MPGLSQEESWRPVGGREDAALRIAKALGLRLPIARVLAARGWHNPASAYEFLHPRPEQLSDPFAMPGMEVAVNRILAAVSRCEPILVYGDFDVDGICATAVLLRCLRSLGATCEAYLPHRIREGYGVHPHVLETAASHGIRLVITVDVGITATDAAAHASALGLDLIISDHHRPPETLPQATAILHPALSGGDEPFSHLCGAGVAYKLAAALHRKAGLPLQPGDDLAWVALATVADAVPLVGENRILAAWGLRFLRTSPSPGILALCRSAGVDPSQLNAREVAFTLAPRLNACGRLGDARPALELLLAEREEQARRLAAHAEAENQRRQSLQQRILEEAKARAEGDCHAVLVLSDPHWHVGVLGIVASRLVEETGRPTLLAVEEETGTARGSGRSVPGFSLIRAFHACEDVLDAFGGHDQAAGFRIPITNLPLLRDRLSRCFDDSERTETKATRTYDADLDVSDIDAVLLEQYEQLEPFGEGNPEPVFRIPRMRVRGFSRVGKDGNHLKIRVDGKLDGIAFRMGDQAEVLAGTEWVECLASLRRNSREGWVRPALSIEAIRAVTTQALPFVPRRLTRDVLAGMYRFLLRAPRETALPFDFVVRELVSRSGLPPSLVRKGFQVFKELGLAHIDHGNVRLVSSPQRVDLWDSPTFRQAAYGGETGEIPHAGEASD